MIFAVLLFTCGVGGIIARPNIGIENISNDNLLEIPPWPLTSNVFLLPRRLRAGDTINITLVIANTPLFDIRLMSQNNTSNFTNVICRFVVDKVNKVVTMYTGDGEELYQDDLIHFLHEENDKTFNVWFKRRQPREINHYTGSDDGHDNILGIHSKFKSKHFKIKHLDSLRYLQFTGNVKVSKLEFEFI